MGSIRRLARGALRRTLSRIAPAEVQTALRYLRASDAAAFPRKNVTVERELPRCRVLVLSPHPDDEAIGPGGTLLAHVQGGSEVHVLYLTDGGGVGGDREGLIATRQAEAREAGRRLGVQQTFWDRRDTELVNDPSTVDALIALLEAQRPQRVYLPSFFDTHFDHFATNQILVDAATRLGWDGTVCGYEVWDAVPFPNYLVDVSPWAAERDAVLACYRTPHATTDFTKLVRYRTSVHYTLHVNSHRDRADRGFAEAFLRFDAETYCRLQREYLEALRAAKSTLASRVQ